MTIFLFRLDIRPWVREDESPWEDQQDAAAGPELPWDGGYAGDGLGAALSARLLSNPHPCVTPVPRLPIPALLVSPVTHSSVSS